MTLTTNPFRSPGSSSMPHTGLWSWKIKSAVRYL